MLSPSDNERITRTGPGTAMGELFRRFWLPALLSNELAEPDGTPVRLRLLGERLIAFRDSLGRVGLLDERCPHRHASLYWGRNEECGIRCSYHGWKFDVDGTCLDQPAEPVGSRLKDHVGATAYETHEAGGIIWAYLGPKGERPAFPDFEWTLLEENQYLVHKRFQDCNYLQNLEGELDTSHFNFLHRSWGPGESVMPDEDVRRKHFVLAETDFGLLAMARSNAGDDQYYWRMTPFHLPTFTVTPTMVNGAYTWTAAVPIDDVSMYGFTVVWDPTGPIQSRQIMMDVEQDTFVPIQNRSNDYGRDLDLQRTSSFTGISNIRLQDMAVQEDQDGPLLRRDEESLGANDRAIIAMRRLLLHLADDLEEGISPLQLKHPESYRVRSVSVTTARQLSPVELWERFQPVAPGTTAIGDAR